MDGDIQVKMENQLLVEVKSEKLDTELTVPSAKCENVETFVLNGELDIKSEYIEDTISDLTWDRIKVEEKLERGIEADSTADNVDQMEFQESVKLEEKPPMSSTSSEDMNALVLHEEIDIKTESDEIDDLTYDSAHIKKNWERKHKCSQMEEEKKLFSRYVCNYTDRSEMRFKCNMAFKHKASLDDHIVRKHAEYIGSVSSKIHECTICDFKTVHKNNLAEHMSKHTNANASNLHICEHCNTSFKRKESLFDHILKKHPDFSEAVSNKIYECVHGDFKTTKRASFKTHMAKHDTQRPFECINCDASYKAKQTLYHHIVQKHPELTDSVSCKIYECIQCEYKTTYASELAEHDMQHTGVKLPCIQCNELFTSKRSLDNHVSRKHHVSYNIHQCTHCEYKTTHPRNLTNHMTKHTGAKLTCTKCDASFRNKQLLDDHILQKHPEFTASVSHKIHKCTHCQYKTTYTGLLDRHMLKHTKLRCKNCDKSFTSQRSLDNHILQKHPEFTASVSHKIHECTHCQYKTRYRRLLDRHMMKHTGAKLTCSKCDASFTSKLSLDNHILQKHPEITTSVSRKIHNCTRCEYKTTVKHSLAKHIMKHTGDKLTCTKSDASFTSKLSLDNHTLQKHPEVTDSLSRKRHKCTHCQYKTAYRRLLPIHMTKHTGAKLKCTKCDASFTTKQSLANHILQKHPGLPASVSHKIHKCTHCQYKTIYTRYLDRHVMKHSAKLTCTRCDATFTSKRWFDNHILQKHPEVTISEER